MARARPLRNENLRWGVLVATSLEPTRLPRRVLTLVAISKRASLRSSRVGVRFRLSCQILPRKATTNTLPAARTIQLDIDSVITLFLGSRKRKRRQRK